jgi:hypothetical protein
MLILASLALIGSILAGLMAGILKAGVGNRAPHGPLSRIIRPYRMLKSVLNLVAFFILLTSTFLALVPEVKAQQGNQGTLQHFDLDYRGSPPHSDGNDQTIIIASPCSNFTLFFYYMEGNTGNPYIIRVYPEWDKDNLIANSDNNEAVTEGEGLEVGGFRWDVETYTVPCTPGTYKVRIVYRASTTHPTWDNYDRLLAEGTVIVVHSEGTAWITIYTTIERAVISTTTVTFTTQYKLTTTMYNIIERTVTFTAQDTGSRTVSIAALIFSALILVVSLTILRRRKTFMKEYHHTPSNVSDELLRRTKLMELERLRAEGKISEEAYNRLREEFEGES